MPATIKKLPHSHVQFEIIFTEDLLEKWRPKALAKLAGETKMDGFRAGNIPPNVLKDRYGDGHIKAYTVDFAFPSIYAEFVKEHELQVVAKPKVEEKGDNPPTFEISVAVYPEITVGKYKKISVPKKEIKVEEKDVDEVINNFRKRQSSFRVVERAAQKGDKVEIDFDGFDKKGVAIEKTASKNHPLIIGDQTFLGDFEKNLEGMNVGEKKEFWVTFPKDYHVESMKKLKVRFEVTLNKVEEVVLPEIDEKFIETMGGKKGVSPEQFKKDIETHLMNEKEREQRVRRENELVDKLISISKVDLPAEMVDEEVDLMLEDLKRSIGQKNITWEQYLEHRKKNDEEIRVDFRDEATRRLSARLAFQDILNKEDISVSKEDMEKEVESMKRYYAGSKKADKMDEIYKEGGQMYEELKRRLQLGKLMESMLEGKLS